MKHWNYVSGQLLHSTTVGDPIKSMVHIDMASQCLQYATMLQGIGDISVFTRSGFQVIPEGGTHAYLQCDWQAQAAGKASSLH